MATWSREEVIYVLSFAVLIAGTAIAIRAVRRPRLDVIGSALATGGSAAWLLSNTPREGRTLLVVLPGNGVTAADLGVLPATVVVAYLCWRRLRGGRA